MAHPLQLAVIVASTRDGRFGPTIADWFVGQAARLDELGVDLIDLAEARLPVQLTPTPASEGAQALAVVGERLAAADLFVVVTPEYNHSYPAPLKNAIDWYRTQWQAKPVGFVSYGGLSGGLRAVEHLRQVFAELHTVTVRETVSFHGAGAEFTPEGGPRRAEASNAAATTLLDQLIWWGRALSAARAEHPYGA